jgi:hypothetical protein|tara:strand:- start:20156 stop:20392 length:237 start_codon:yes stop_codon:yes gene_type:complete
MNSDLIADIWTIMVEHIEEKKKKDVAASYINALLDYGVSESVIQGLFGIDTYLDEAVEYVLDDEEVEDYDEDEDDRWD